MLTLPRLAIALALVGTAALARGEGVKVGRPSLRSTHDGINVSIGGTPKADLALVRQVAMWTVVARTTEQPAGFQVSIKDVIVEPGIDYATQGMLRLVFVAAIQGEVKDVDVVPLFPDSKRVTWTPKKPEGKLGLFEVDKREKADVYLFGSWMTGTDIAPIYNIDVSVGSPSAGFMWRKTPWEYSAKGTVKTADKRNADPDSYLISGTIQPVFPKAVGKRRSYVSFQWEAARAEFSRKDESSNLVTAPVVTFSNTPLVTLRADRTVKAAIDVDFLAGVDVGRNLQSKIVPEGYGTIARIVPGVIVTASFPRALGVKEVRWNSIYRARILLAKEAFTDSRDDDNPFPSVARGTRHELKDELEFKITSLVSLKFTHDYGSTPPAFNILNHRFTLGATAMWRWKE